MRKRRATPIVSGNITPLQNALVTRQITRQFVRRIENDPTSRTWIIPENTISKECEFIGTSVSFELKWLNRCTTESIRTECAVAIEQNQNYLVSSLSARLRTYLSKHSSVSGLFSKLWGHNRNSKKPWWLADRSIPMSISAPFR